MDDSEAPDWNDPEMGEDATVESQTERSGKLDWFGCGVGLHSAENNRRCGVEGVGERSNFKKFPTHTQDHGDA